MTWHHMITHKHIHKHEQTQKTQPQTHKHAHITDISQIMYIETKNCRRPAIPAPAQRQPSQSAFSYVWKILFLNRPQFEMDIFFFVVNRAQRCECHKHCVLWWEGGSSLTRVQNCCPLPFWNKGDCARVLFERVNGSHGCHPSLRKMEQQEGLQLSRRSRTFFYCGRVRDDQE